jgi:hypothetical protein
MTFKKAFETLDKYFSGDSHVHCWAWQVIRNHLSEAAISGAVGCTADTVRATCRALSAPVAPSAGTPSGNTSLDAICPTCKSTNVENRCSYLLCNDCGMSWD